MRAFALVLFAALLACSSSDEVPVDAARPDAEIDARAPVGNGCGNQAFFDVAGDYSTLASALADDVLIIDTDYGSCGYLDVELNITSSCGGRSPSDDVVDVSYSVLATGRASGVGDGVASDDVGVQAQFPFLRPPTQ
jgi:hypothetical protein